MAYHNAIGIPNPWDTRICMGDLCVYVSKEILWNIVLIYEYVHLRGGDGPSFSTDFFPQRSIRFKIG